MEVIRVEDVSKLYRLGEVGTGTLSHDLNRWWARMRGREDPFAKVARVNDRTQKGDKGLDYVWALQDINFSVQQGEVLGIIGRNGAGKSTLLKIISRITAPTRGDIKIKGRIGSLLEVGTGFHPEMTGRENIFMNGTLLGMRRREIQAKLDDIVDFAGVALYLDTPVKRYSSGMMVRLGFAVAAFLEPEILIVDEVLAVGDAEFQKKALGRMGDVSKQHGRTILFVSHNMAAVRALCTRGILLTNGCVEFDGEVNNAVVEYQSSSSRQLCYERKWSKEEAPGNNSIKVRRISIGPLNGSIVSIESGLVIGYEIENYLVGKNLGTTMEVLTSDEVVVFHSGVVITKDKNSRKGKYLISVEVPPFLLNANTYRLNLLFGENQRYVLFKMDDIISFEIENSSDGAGSNMSRLPGIVRPKLTWRVVHHELGS